MNRPWIASAMLLLTVAAGAATAADAPSRTFYVDATHGDDRRDGLRPETAWRSLVQVNGVALEPGDTVLFQRGEVWRGQLVPQSGTAAGAINYGAFGDGPKPLLLGSAAMDQPEDWQPAGAGVWATVPARFEPVGTPVDLGRARWSLHQEAGAAVTVHALAPGEDGGTEYRLACQQSGTAANHIQWSTAGLSLREGDYYLFTFRARSTQPFAAGRLVLMQNGPPYTAYAETESAPTRIGADWAEHTIRFRATHTAAGARITWYLGGTLPAGAALSFQPGRMTAARCSQAIPLAVDVGNIVFDDGQATGVKKWSPVELRQVGDYFYDAQSWQVLLRADANPATRYRRIELALRKHIIDQSNRGYVTYENLALRYGAAHGIGGSGTHHITVRDCDLAYIGGGHQFTLPAGKPVRFGNGIEFWSDAHDSTVEGCRLWEIYDAALTNQGSGTNVQENLTYRRNVIWNCEYSFEYWNRGPASRTRNIRFEHNTCVDAGHGWGHGQRPDPNGRHLMFYDNSSVTEGVVIRHNIFCNATDSLLRLHGRDWTAALTMDHNDWFQSQGPLWLWGAESVGAEHLTAFQKQRGLDQHSLVADPKFVEPTHHDYRLAPDSPLRALTDQGLPVGALP